MGDKWHVEIWGQWEPGEDYSYNTVYMGESAWQAIRAFLRYRGQFGCVTLHHRGKK